jgi:MurNAc alpha-1-phosphate uridylyltransferase
MDRPLPSVAILAGGLATRLRPITNTIPKALVPVAGKPFLAHQLELLRRQGFGHVVLCVGHLGEQIEAAFGDGRAQGVRLEYSYDGPAPIGTAAALRQTLPSLGPSFLTLYGDSYLEIDYVAVCDRFLHERKPALMTVIRHTDGVDRPNACYENGTVKAYGKTDNDPRMQHVDYGLGFFRPEAFLGDRAGIADLSKLQARLAADGDLAGHEVFRPYFEIGSPRGLAELESHLKTAAASP